MPIILNHNNNILSVFILLCMCACEFVHALETYIISYHQIDLTVLYIYTRQRRDGRITIGRYIYTIYHVPITNSGR